MSRKKRQDIKLNDISSLESLAQEIYQDACLQINDAQKAITELVLAVPHDTSDIDDLTKVAREKGSLLKVKETGIKYKLEVAKLQNDIIKSNNITNTDETESVGAPSVKDFQKIRDMIKNSTSSNDNN